MKMNALSGLQPHEYGSTTITIQPAPEQQDPNKPLPQIIVSNNKEEPSKDPVRTNMSLHEHHQSITSYSYQDQGYPQMTIHDNFADDIDIDRPAYVESPSARGVVHDEDDYYDPLSMLCWLQTCVGTFLLSEHVQRALCFGAMDGILTGSGITAACAGMGLFHPFYTSHLQRIMILILSISASASDGLCMGISHICSSYLSQERSIKERHREEWMFNNFRSVSKARMVDALLRRGMLKIDATSVADTLEGYPHIFVSALAGDAQGAGPIGIGDDNLNRDPINKQSADSSFASHSSHHRRTAMHYDDSFIMGEEEEGCCTNFSPECWIEGFVMMLSFSLFSISPSFIYGFAPVLIYSKKDGLPDDSTTGISCASLAITALSIVVFLLGTWKSKFFQASWIAFGIEAVFLLLASIFSAYGLGFFIAHLTGIHKTGFTASTAVAEITFQSNY